MLIGSKYPKHISICFEKKIAAACIGSQLFCHFCFVVLYFRAINWQTLKQLMSTFPAGSNVDCISFWRLRNWFFSIVSRLSPLSTRSISRRSSALCLKLTSVLGSSPEIGTSAPIGGVAAITGALPSTTPSALYSRIQATWMVICTHHCFCFMNEVLLGNFDPANITVTE